MCYMYSTEEMNMNNESGKKLKETIVWGLKNPLEAGVEFALYIFCVAMGIWIIGFALGFLIKVMSPIILLT